MRLQRWFLIAILAIGLGSAFALTAPQPARASAPIYQALMYIRNLNSDNFNKLTMWARSGAMQPMVVFTDSDRAAASVANLPGNQRNAMVQWLSGRGRGGLYALGVNDSDIGPRRAGADVAMATPDPWRPLRFATTSLGGDPDQSGVTILNGFGAATKDGKQLMACVSFKSTSPKTASRVLFRFDIVGDSAKEMGSFALSRTGTFSTGIDINTFGSYEQWRSGSQHRGYSENCKTESGGMAAVPVLEARFITPIVVEVDYADGSFWSFDLTRH
jgi:hypothetical protein